jgi:hypothetical protein
MSFRLIDILWVFALLAAAFALFGSSGIVVAFGVTLFWAAVFDIRRTTILGWTVVFTVLLIIAALLAPYFFYTGRQVFRHKHCLHNVEEIAAALLRQAERRGTLPPASMPLGNQRTSGSWRVRILPLLERYSIFDAYHHNEPWDSTWNYAMRQAGIDFYHCPSDVHAAANEGYANYFAVVGPRTVWSVDRERALSDIKDDRARTILLLEAYGLDIPWIEPRDLTFDEAVAILTGKSQAAAKHSRFRDSGFFYMPPPLPGASIAFADGSTRFMALPISKELATALLTVDGGEKIDEREFKRLTQPQLDYSRCYAFATFVLLALLPLVRLGRRWRLRLSQ